MPEGFTDIGFAKVDTDRRARCGFAEVVFGQGKTADQVTAIARELLARSGYVLITRIAAAEATIVRGALPELVYNPSARTLRGGSTPPVIGVGLVAVVTAGTSDLPVADECIETLGALGIASRQI